MVCLSCLNLSYRSSCSIIPNLAEKCRVKSVHHNCFLPTTYTWYHLLATPSRCIPATSTFLESPTPKISKYCSQSSSHSPTPHSSVNLGKLIFKWWRGWKFPFLSKDLVDEFYWIGFPKGLRNSSFCFWICLILNIPNFCTANSNNSSTFSSFRPLASIHCKICYSFLSFFSTLQYYQLKHSPYLDVIKPSVAFNLNSNREFSTQFINKITITRKFYRSRPKSTKLSNREQLSNTWSAEQAEFWKLLRLLQL